MARTNTHDVKPLQQRLLQEPLLNSGGSITKTIHNIDINATPEQIKDIVLHNQSNLKTPSQRLHAFNSIQQKPDEALQTYISWYESHFHTQTSQLMMLDPGHSVSHTPVHFTAN